MASRSTAEDPPMPALVSRRRFFRDLALCSSVLPAAAAIDGTLITPRRLTTTRLTLGSPTASGSRAFRVVQISDLHIRELGPLEEAVLGAVQEATPDLVVITGDSVDHQSGLGPLDDLLAGLPGGVRRLAVPGNWEYKARVDTTTLRRHYDRQGVELLVNQSLVIEHADHCLRVTGLDDLVCGTPDPTAALTTAEPLMNHLVLAHCPASREAIPMPPKHAASLILAGHTHGGQVAPGGIALVTPPGSGPYVAGWYHEAGQPLYVSRGLGNSLIPFRLGAMPELVILDWWLAAG
jgi:predicted MPP superfamily phosphohydrolase